MNRFLVFPCAEQDDEGYKGPVVSLASTSNMTFVLFFPISEEYSKMINFVLKKEKVKANFQLLSVYQTMLDSWKAGDRYLSGIVMDIVYDEDTEENIIDPSLILCDSMGNVDAVLHISFVHAVMLAAMERKEMLVTNELLETLLRDEDEIDEMDEIDAEIESADVAFPVDKKILDIAKDIMNGKKKQSDPEAHIEPQEIQDLELDKTKPKKIKKTKKPDDPADLEEK